MVVTLNHIEQLAAQRAALAEQLESATRAVAKAATDAVLDGTPKTLVAAWANVPRMTLDRWLKDRKQAEQ